MSSRKYKYLVAICAIIGLYQLSWKIRRKIRKLPPGPTPLTTLYYLVKMLIVKRKFDIVYLNRDLAARYDADGVFYQPSWLGFNLIKITTSSMAKQILNNKMALDRPVFGKKNSVGHIESTVDGTAPFSNINGTEWEKRRKLAQSIMFRMCTSKFVNKILNESICNVLFPELDKLVKENKLFYPSALMKYLAFNTVFYANYGTHISYNNPLYHETVQIIIETFELFQSGIVYSFLPEYLMFFIKLNPYSDYYRILKVIKKRSELFQQMVKLRNNDKQENKDEIYYIDYIQKELTPSEAEADMSALFGAGTDTTSSTLSFAVIFCAKYPNIQSKVRKELIKCYNDNNMDKIKKDDGIKRFDMHWINQLVYFRAFIHEVMRVGSVVQLGLPHFASKGFYFDVGDKKYYIPKGSIITYVIEFVHKNNDKENWTNSSPEMCLENWINKETNKFEANESFLTFGTGRRDCVGRTLAMKQLYIIMAYLLLNYSFKFEDENDIKKPIKTVFNGVNVIDPPIGVVVNRL